MALATGMSRRAADTAVEQGKVTVNGEIATSGQQVSESDKVLLDNSQLLSPKSHITIMLNKPVGYVVSRDGQGSKTIYDLMPPEYHHLKPVGRLDKDSSGLLLLTNDGDLANELTHPSRQKTKIYEVTVDKPLQPLHHQMLVDFGVELEDGPSKFDALEKMDDSGKNWTVELHEGRNRQIRRTFAALGYKVTKLHRTQFGSYRLDGIEAGTIKLL